MPEASYLAAIIGEMPRYGDAYFGCSLMLFLATRRALPRLDDAPGA